MFIFTSLLAGLVFGLGLIVSGMANPAKVLGFLDLTGSWDPSLALVMAGAITISFFAFLVAKTRTRSLIGADMKLPGGRHIDRRLVVGSLLFGIGWAWPDSARGRAWWLWAWAKSRRLFLWLRC